MVEVMFTDFHLFFTKAFCFACAMLAEVTPLAIRVPAGAAEQRPFAH
jgi:hypothetical protein